jgi:hypothetical protein
MIAFVLRSRCPARSHRRRSDYADRRQRRDRSATKALARTCSVLRCALPNLGPPRAAVLLRAGLRRRCRSICARSERPRRDFRELAAPASQIPTSCVQPREYPPDGLRTLPGRCWRVGSTVPGVATGSPRSHWRSSMGPRTASSSLAVAPHRRLWSRCPDGDDAGSCERIPGSRCAGVETVPPISLQVPRSTGQRLALIQLELEGLRRGSYRELER